MDNRFNKIILFFSSFNCEFSLGNRLIDIFPNHFSFHSLNRKNDYNVKSQLYKLNSITLQTLLDPHSVIVIIDASIKNQIAMLISHVDIHNSSVIKIIYHTVNVIFTKAELFTIRYSTN